MKPDEVLDQQRRYDVMRVAESMRLREVQEKKEEIKENMSSLHFHVRYRGHPEKKENHQSIYIRNLDNQKILLKLPESAKAPPREHHTRDDEEHSSHKSKDNSKYLKLLQNYQM